MANNQIEDCYQLFKKENLNKDYDGENKIVQTKNIVFQISNLEDLKNNTNPLVSSIDLGECELILKKNYNISNEDSLIIIKTDMKNEELSITYVQYEIFHPYSLIKLNMSFCYNKNIVINSVVNLSDETISLYKSLKESGYNLFNSEDSFYNDICTTYTSVNGTDMILSDRQNEIFSLMGNISICQKGCKFESYNDATRKAKCNCDIQDNKVETNITKIEFYKNLIFNSFIKSLYSSNIIVLKCYMEAINIETLLKNIGRIVMIVLLFSYLILLFLFCIIDKKKLDFYISTLIKDKSYFLKIRADNKNAKSKSCKSKKEKKKENKKEKKMKNKKDTKNENQKENKKDKKINKEEEKSEIKKKGTNKSKLNEPSKKSNKIRKEKEIKSKKDKLHISTKKLIYKRGSNLIINRRKKLKKIDCKNVILNTNLSGRNQNDDNKKTKDKFLINNKSSNFVAYVNNDNPKSNIIEDISFINLNYYELNNLSYNAAIAYDKRTFFQYYCSLLKMKHILLFTFFPSNDYNLLTLKIILFLISFSLFLCVNTIFFTDNTMHRIYIDYGDYNFIYNIPQIIFSTIISSIITMILKLLSLSEKNLLIIKQEKNLSLAIQKSQNIKSCFNIKLYAIS